MSVFHRHPIFLPEIMPFIIRILDGNYILADDDVDHLNVRSDESIMIQSNLIKTRIKNTIRQHYTWVNSAKHDCRFKPELLDLGSGSDKSQNGSNVTDL